MYNYQSSLPAKVSQPDAVRLYDRLSGVYDIWAQLTESKARSRALELSGIRNGMHVLEVAVGTGLAFSEVVLHNSDGRNVGLDISPGMLARAEKRLRRTSNENCELLLGSAFDLPEEDNSIDVLLNNYMFDLLDQRDWPKVLQEFHRVLKPHGTLVLVNMTLGEKPGSGLYERLYQISPKLMGGCRGVRLSEPVQQNGFSVEHREYVQQMLFPSEVIIARKQFGLD